MTAALEGGEWSAARPGRPGKDLIPILQEAGWAPGPVLTGGKSRPHRDSIPDRPARSSVAIPTELPDPQTRLCNSVKTYTECVSLLLEFVVFSWEYIKKKKLAVHSRNIRNQYQLHVFRNVRIVLPSKIFNSWACRVSSLKNEKAQRKVSLRRN